MVTLGDTPAGFTQTTPLTVPVPVGAQVQESNGCWSSSEWVPRSLPARGIVADGSVMTRQEFAKEDTGYLACAPGVNSPVSYLGGVVMAVGAVLLIWCVWSVHRRSHAA